MSSVLQPIEVGGTVIWVEVAELPAESGVGRKTVPTSTGAVRQASEALVKVDIGRTLQAVIGPVHDALKAVSPGEVSVELALGIKGEVGVFVAKGEGNASLKVTAKWKFDAPKTG